MTDQWTSWIWRQIGFCLPADWEMLQFSKKPSRGRCTFADRYAFRFELVWSEVPGAPDYERMLKDYRTRLELSEKLEDAKEEQHGQWLAISGRQEGQWITRFGRHFPQLGIMAEFVILHDGDRDLELEQAIIQTGKEVPVIDQHTEWRAFGLRTWAHESHPLEEAKIAPAQIHLRFKNAQQMEQLSVERIGLLSHWLQGSTETWFASQHPASVKQWEVNTILSDGVKYHIGTGTLPGSKRFGPPRHLELAAWVNPIDKRLYRCRTIQQECFSSSPPWERSLCKQPTAAYAEVREL